MTSLMDKSIYPDSSAPAEGCGLGAIAYDSDFAPMATTCFGPGGYYESKHTSNPCHNLISADVSER